MQTNSSKKNKIMRKTATTLTFATLLLLSACGNNSKTKDMNTFKKGTFGYDKAFLSQYDNSIVVLSDPAGNACVAVSPKYQAKVFTSTAEGDKGQSFGWINYEAFDKQTSHINAYGGANRLWIGPEGGAWSIFFAPGVDQIYDHWQTAPPIDSEPWQLTAHTKSSADMQKQMRVTNYKGSEFLIKIERSVTLLTALQIEQSLDIKLSTEVKSVAYSTQNTIVNIGDKPWTEETGAVCIWILDMFAPSSSSVTVIPYVAGNEKELGKVATTDYFGEIPPQWLQINDDAIFMKTDGNLRSKIGVAPQRAKNIAGNYDPETKVLTITVFDIDPNAVYLNQEWRLNADPVKGDAVNAYNDGPLADGTQMGPFYEIESVSPAAFLKPGEELSHRHDVYHFVGEEQELSILSEALLGVSVRKIKKVF